MSTVLVKPKSYNPADYFVVSSGFGCDFVICKACGWSTRIASGSVRSIGYHSLSRHLRRHGLVIELRLWVDPNTE